MDWSATLTPSRTCTHMSCRQVTRTSRGMHRNPSQVLSAWYECFAIQGAGQGPSTLFQDYVFSLEIWAPRIRQALVSVSSGRLKRTRILIHLGLSLFANISVDYDTTDSGYNWREYIRVSRTHSSRWRCSPLKSGHHFCGPSFPFVFDVCGLA